MRNIRLSANWDTASNIQTRLLAQFKTPDIDLTDVNFVTDDSYDVLVSFNHVSLPVTPSKRSFVFPHEPRWSGSHQKVFRDGTVVFGFNKEEYVGECIETPAHTFYGGRGPWVDTLDIWCYNYLLGTPFIKSKTISSVVTNLSTAHSPTCLYPQRARILNELADLPFIDLFGSGLSIPSAKSSPKKIDAVRDYMFNICIENDCSNNWISERFYDAILTDTIPIYYGCKNIRDIYPEDGYIVIEDIDDPDRLKSQLLDIQKNAESLYAQKFEGARKIKRRYFTDYNLLRKIIQL